MPQVSEHIETQARECGRQRCRPLRGLNLFYLLDPGGLRPRLYAAARFAGSMIIFMRSWGLAPQALCLRLLGRLRRTFRQRCLNVARQVFDHRVAEFAVAGVIKGSEHGAGVYFKE